MPITILGIESSCDDTAAAVILNRKILSNVIATQAVHQQYGGVVPELASRAHQQNIVAVVDTALKQANTSLDSVDAIAFTLGPGLIGSLTVGVSFAKGLSLARRIPLIEVDHLHAHILAHFIENEEARYPSFPFLCLLVSGGNTQIILVKDYLEIEIIGKTIDDAAGEAFDKCAKMMGIPYPGGAEIDKLAKDANSLAFEFSKPRVKDLDFSFSGLKTSFLYFLRDSMEKDTRFIEKNISDLSASLQRTIVEILLEKVEKAARDYGINQIALAGGVSANSALRQAIRQKATQKTWEVYIPPLAYSVDNAAMVAITAYYKHKKKQFSSHYAAPYARVLQG